MRRRERTGSCSSRHVMQLGLARIVHVRRKGISYEMKSIILFQNRPHPSQNLYCFWTVEPNWQRNWGDCSLLQGDHGRQTLVRFELCTGWWPCGWSAADHIPSNFFGHATGRMDQTRPNAMAIVVTVPDPQNTGVKRTWAYWGSHMSEHPNKKDGQLRTGCDFIHGECTWADCDTGRAEVRSEQIASGLWGPVVESSWIFMTWQMQSLTFQYIATAFETGTIVPSKFPLFSFVLSWLLRHFTFRIQCFFLALLVVAGLVCPLWLLLLYMHVFARTITNGVFAQKYQKHVFSELPPVSQQNGMGSQPKGSF